MNIWVRGNLIKIILIGRSCKWLNNNGHNKNPLVKNDHKDLKENRSKLRYFEKFKKKLEL